MRNEIYARYGRPFRDPELARYFATKKWYAPDPDYTDRDVSDYDRKAARMILESQQKLGGSKAR